MANKSDKLKGQTHRGGSWKAYNICDMEVDCNHFLLFICEMYMVILRSILNLILDLNLEVIKKFKIVCCLEF